MKIQDILCLFAQPAEADACCLRKVYKKNQYGINDCKGHSGICSYMPVFITFIMQSCCHHDITNRQKHTDEIGAEKKVSDQTDRKKNYCRCNDR